MILQLSLSLIAAFLFFCSDTVLNHRTVGDFVVAAHQTYLGMPFLPHAWLWQNPLASSLFVAAGFLIWLRSNKRIDLFTLVTFGAVLLIVQQDFIFAQLFFLSVLLSIQHQKSWYLRLIFALFCTPHYTLLALLFSTLFTPPIEKKKFLSAVVLASIIALVAPFPLAPQYPFDAILIPDSGLNQNFLPFFPGPSSSSFLNEQAIQTNLKPLLGILIPALFLIWKPQRALAIFSLILMAAIILPPTDGLIFPLAAAQRLLPFALTISLSWYSVIFFLLALPRLIEKHGSRIVCSLLLGGISLFMHVTQESSTQKKAQCLSSDSYASPSRYLLETYDAALICASKATLSKRISKNHYTIESQPKTEEQHLAALSDRNPKTRWSFFNGKQATGDRLLITFDAPTKVQGIELSNEFFPGDYPRGLKVRGGTTCQENNLSETISLSPNIGSPLWTKDSFPYPGPLTKTRLVFPQVTEISCLEISLLVSHAGNDWSIGELTFFSE